MTSAHIKTEKPKPGRHKFGRRVLIGGHFHPEVARLLRVIASENSTKVQQLLIDAINEILARYGKPKIAGIMPEPGEN